MSVEHQKHINKYFPNKAILYQPGLAIALGSANAAIILGQLLFWHTKQKRPDGFIYKTHEDMTKETGLSRSQQDHALKVLTERGIIDRKLAQVPAKRHFRVNFVTLQKLLPSLKKSSKPVYANPPMCLDDNLQPITKSTQETTSKTTYRDTSTNIVAIGDVLSKRSVRPP